jgi:hypothetical protein
MIRKYIIYNMVKHLLKAVNTNNIKTVTDLLKNGAKINVSNQYNDTVLHLVTDLDIAKLLITYGANVNAIDITGRTPLHVVKNLEICQLLIDNGAKLETKSKCADKTTPLTDCIGQLLLGRYAGTNYNKAVLLISNGADCTQHVFEHEGNLMETLFWRSNIFYNKYVRELIILIFSKYPDIANYGYRVDPEVENYIIYPKNEAIPEQNLSKLLSDKYRIIYADFTKHAIQKHAIQRRKLALFARIRYQKSMS